MRKIIAAKVKTKGIRFVVVQVQNGVINKTFECSKLVSQCRRWFEGAPVILMGKDPSGRIKYYGRNEIVKFLLTINPSQLPFREYIVFY